MTGDTYENKQAWERTVKNAAQAGVLDDPKALMHVKARTLAEHSAMAEQNRALSRSSFGMPPGYERIFTVHAFPQVEHEKGEK